MFIHPLRLPIAPAPKFVFFNPSDCQEIGTKSEPCDIVRLTLTKDQLASLDAELVARIVDVEQNGNVSWVRITKAGLPQGALSEFNAEGK